MCIESGYSSVKEEAPGFCQSMVPVIEKVYDNPEDKKEAYRRHTELFLTEGRMAAFCVGIAAAMEERYANKKDIDPESINSIKIALMGPFAGVGDSLIHGTARPIFAGLACSIIMASGYTSVTGALLFMLIMSIISFGVRYIGVFKGHESGIDLVEKMQTSGIIDKLTSLASIAAYVVCGGFISSLVWCYVPVAFEAGDTSIALQEVLDGLMPSLIPLLYTLLMYWLISKKKVNIVVLIFATLILGIVGVYAGFLA